MATNFILCYRLKLAIEKQYRKMHYAVTKMEECREKMNEYIKNGSDTNSEESPVPFNPFIVAKGTENPYNWPQPICIPRIWYKVFNIETIVLQLFTPKLPVLSYLDDDVHLIRMRKVAEVMMVPRMLIPIPNKNENEKTCNVVQDISVTINAVDKDDREKSVPTEQATYV